MTIFILNWSDADRSDVASFHVSSPPPSDTSCLHLHLFGYILMAKKNITAGAKNFDVEHFLPVLQDIPFQRILTRTSHPLALSNLLDKGSG